MTVSDVWVLTTVVFASLAALSAWADEVRLAKISVAMAAVFGCLATWIVVGS